MRDLQVKRIEACLCYFNCVFLTHFRCSEHFFFVFYFFTRFSRFQSSMIFTFILRYSIYFITLSLVCKNLCRWNLCKEEEYPRYSMSVFFHLCFIPEKAETHEKDVSGVKRVRVLVVCCFLAFWNEKHFVGDKFSIFSSFYA